jgi:Iap family predicted aminopeptidase
MMMCLSALCMGFTSCGDKDDEKENDNYGQAIAGTYSGNLQMAGATIVPSASITIARDDDRHVTLKMNESVMGLSVNIECKSDVTYSNNQYRVAGNTTFNMTVEGAPAPIPVPVVVDGTIDRNGKASININVDVPVTGAVAVVFDGQRQ